MIRLGVRFMVSLADMLPKTISNSDCLGSPELVARRVIDPHWGKKQTKQEKKQ